MLKLDVGLSPGTATHEPQFPHLLNGELLPCRADGSTELGDRMRHIQGLTHSPCSVNIGSHIIGTILGTTEACFLFHPTHFSWDLLKWIDVAIEPEGPG